MVDFDKLFLIFEVVWVAALSTRSSISRRNSFEDLNKPILKLINNFEQQLASKFYQISLFCIVCHKKKIIFIEKSVLSYKQCDKLSR